MSDVFEEAIVRFAPDFSGFKTSYDSYLRTVNTDLTIKAKLDSASFDSQIRSISGKTVDVHMTRSGEGTPERIRRDLEKLQAEYSHSLNINMILNGLTKAREQIASLSRSITVHVKTDTSGANAGTGSLFSKGGSFGGGTLGRAQTIGAELLSVNAAPVTASVVALGSAFAASGAAVGAFGVAAVGQITRLTDVMKQLSAGTLALSDLPADLKGMVGALQQFQASYNKFLQDTEKPVFQTFEAGLTVVESGLNKIEPLVNVVAGAFTKSIGVVGQFVNGPEVQSFLGIAQREAPQAIATLTSTAEHFSAGITRIFTGTAPAGQSFLNTLDNISARFDAFTSRLTQSNGFQSFVQYAETYGPRIVNTFANIAETAGHVAVALAPIGAIAVDIADGLSKVASAIPIGVLTAAVAGFVAYRVAIIGVGVVTSVVGGIKSFTAAIQTAIAFTQLATDSTVGLAAAFKGLTASEISTGIGAIVAVIGIAAAALYSWSQAGDSAKQTANQFAVGVDSITDALERNNGALDENTKRTVSNALSKAQVFAQGVDPAKALAGVTDTKAGTDYAAVQAQLNKRADDLAREAFLRRKQKYAPSGLEGTEGTELSGLEGQYGVGGTISNLEKTAATSRTASDVYKAQHDNLVGATSAQNDWNKAIDEGKNKVYDLANAVQNYTAALADEQNGQLGQLAANVTTAYKGLQDATKGVADAQYNQSQVAQQTADANVQAARRVQDANDQLIQSHKEVAKAQKAVTDAQIALTQAREDAAKKLRDQADAEANSQIALERAQRDAAALGLYKGPLATEQQIHVQEVQTQLHSAQSNFADTAEAGTKLRAQGIENQPGVLQAKQAVQDAQDNLDNSIKNEAKARIAVSDAHKQQTLTYQQGEHARQVANQQLSDANTLLADATIQYNDVSGAMDTATGSKRGLDDAFAKQWTLDASDPIAKMKDLSRYLEAVRLLSTSPTLTWQQAWAQAQTDIGTNADAASPLAPGNSTYNSQVPKHAVGGPIYGPGSATSDSIPALLSNNEHVWTASEVQGAGGHENVQRLRNWATLGRLRLATGGPVLNVDAMNLAQNASDRDILNSLSAHGYTAAGNTTPAVPSAVDSNTAIAATQSWLQSIKDKIPYVFGAVGPGSFDCSGLVGEVWARLTGNKSNTRYFTTNDEGAFLTNHGFKSGTGTFTVGFNDHHTVGNIAGTEFEAAHTGTTMHVGTGTQPTSMPNVYYLPTLGNAFVASGGNSGTLVNLPAEMGFPGGSYYVPGGGTTATATGGDIGNLKDIIKVGASMYGGPTDPSVHGDGGAFGHLNGKMAFAELSKDPKKLDFAALGNLPPHTKAQIGYNGKSLIAEKLDVGGGGGPINGYPRDVDLWYQTAAALGFSGTGVIDFKKLRNGGMVVADSGAILPPRSATMVVNGTDKNENVGFGMTDRDQDRLAAKIAQALGPILNSHPVEMDGEIVTKKAKKAVANILTIPGA